MGEFDDVFYQKYNVKVRSKHQCASGFCVAAKKLCFNTKTQARKNRRDLELKHNKYFRMYLCEHCQQWHLASTNDKTQKNH